MPTSFHETDFIQGDNWQPTTELSVTNCSREGDRGPDARTKRWKTRGRRETEFSSLFVDDFVLTYILRHTSTTHVFGASFLVPRYCKYSLSLLGHELRRITTSSSSRISKSRQLKVTPSPTSCSSSNLPWELSPPDQADGQRVWHWLEMSATFLLNAQQVS